MSVSCGRLLLLARTPIIQSIRRKTFDIRKPAIPHWSRAVVLKLVEPKYKDPTANKHPADYCSKKLKAVNEEQERNRFEEILAEELFEKVDNAKLVAIFHQLPMTQATLFAARVQLNKINLQYVFHNNKMARLAFSGTKYEAVLKMYESTTITFVGDKMAVAKLLKLDKKIPGLILLGVIVEGRLLGGKELKEYAALPSLEVMHANLSHTLSSAAQQLSQNLVAHQMELSSSLSRHISNGSTPEENLNE